MKSLYKFNAKKYIKLGLELGAKPDLEWAMMNDGQIIKINNEIGLGALDGRIVMVEACDKREQHTMEDETYLEKLLHHSQKKVVSQLRKCEEALEAVIDERDELIDEVNSLMEAHNNLLDIINEHHDELPTDFMAEIAKKVVLEVLKVIGRKEDSEEHECDLNCTGCNCR